MAEIRAALEGSWLLLRNRPEGMMYFDQSIRGFWRSFSVFFLLLPIYWINGLAEKKFYIVENVFHPDAFPDGEYWTARFLSFGLDWVAFPIVLAIIAAPIGISNRYVPYIVARNWVSLLASVPFLIVSLLFLVGFLSPGITGLLLFASLLMVLWYHVQVVRIALQTTLSLSIGIVMLDLLLSLFIAEMAERMWGI